MKIIHGGIKTITVDVVGAAALPVASNRENQRGFNWDDSNMDFETRTALKADLSGSDTLEGLWRGGCQRVCQEDWTLLRRFHKLPTGESVGGYNAVFPPLSRRNLSVFSSKQGGIFDFA